jgi:protein O-mannosyl-transferase
MTLALIAGITLLAMSPLLTADFVDIDDKKLILEKADMFLNQPERAVTRDYGTPHYKPVTYFMWMLEYRLAGPNPFIFHLNNLLIHILNTCLVFFLIGRIALRFDLVRDHVYPIAFFSALLFGIHPMHVESVGWVVERKDVLYTLFYLLGLWGYVRYLDEEKTWPLILSAIAYFFSMLSKSPGITMLPVLFLLDYVWKRKLNTRLFLEKAGHFAVFGFGLFALGIVGRSHGEGSIASMLTEKKLARAENIREYTSLYGKILLAGLRTFLWYIHSWIPVRLSLGYPREQIIGFFGVFIHAFPWIVASAAGLLIWFRNKYRVTFFSHAFFLLTLGPAIVRLDLGIGIYMSDRYVYLSLLGLIFLFVAWFWTRQKSWLTDKVKLGILIALCAAAAIASFLESRVWKNTETLWTNVINKYPAVDYAWVNRAAFYRDQGRFDLALSDVNRGIALDDNANARIQRGLIYRQMGDPKTALTDYNRAIKLEPDNNQAYTNRGNAFNDLGRFQEAISDYNKVLEKDPGNAKTRVNLAIAYSSLGNYRAAEDEFARAEALSPQYPELFVNRAIMYFDSRQYAKALVDYQRFLQYRPDDHQIHNDLGVVYSVMGNYQKALEAFSLAIQISPQKDYYRMRARAYEALGNATAAEQDRRMAD